MNNHSISENLLKALEEKEANEIGVKVVKLTFEGDTYEAISSLSHSRHNGSNRWRTIKFKKNGKVISKEAIG